MGEKTPIKIETNNLALQKAKTLSGGRKQLYAISPHRAKQSRPYARLQHVRRVRARRGRKAA